ncbi:MAG: GNAT family N-acetyltransferase [Sphingobacteriales bacterium]|nr:GNAT family N-acetyltransferase [Sphingobacteriales bacterium]MBI3719800.1 GNAT family N-acetyltransferase [Sphingobacteriales bacterium]
MIVKIRQWKKADKAALLQLVNNKKIWYNVRDRLPYPYTDKDADEWLKLNVGIKPVLNYVIEVDGKFAGSIGMVPKEDVYRCNMEIGYWIGEPFWNNGVATKAIALLESIIWKEYPDVVRIYADVYEYNKASMKALEKNGFHLEAIHKKAVIKNNLLLDEYVWVKLRAD